MFKIVCIFALFVVCGCVGMPGGWTEVDPNKVDESVKRVAKDHVLRQNVVQQSCTNELSAEKAWSQVVAGVNYNIQFFIPPSCNNANGATSTLTCTVKVFKPLPYKNEGPSVSNTTNNPVCQ